MNNKENYNKLMEQMERLRYKLHEINYYDINSIKIQMNERTLLMIFDAIYPNYHLNMNKLMGFEVEESNDLKDWEVNVKFQDTIIVNPNGTTTRLTNYMNLNNVENLKNVYEEKIRWRR